MVAVSGDTKEEGDFSGNSILGVYLPYIYHTNQPNVGNIPYMDPMNFRFHVIFLGGIYIKCDFSPPVR